MRTFRKFMPRHIRLPPQVAWRLKNIKPLCPLRPLRRLNAAFYAIRPILDLGKDAVARGPSYDVRGKCAQRIISRKIWHTRSLRVSTHRPPVRISSLPTTSLGQFIHNSGHDVHIHNAHQGVQQRRAASGVGLLYLQRWQEVRKTSSAPGSQPKPQERAQKTAPEKSAAAAATAVRRRPPQPLSLRQVPHFSRWRPTSLLMVRHLETSRFVQVAQVSQAPSASPQLGQECRNWPPKLEKKISCDSRPPSSSPLPTSRSGLRRMSCINYPRRQSSSSRR